MNADPAADVRTPPKRGFHTGRFSYRTYLCVRAAYLVADIVLFLPLLLVTMLSRVAPRPVDVGLGPLPAINTPHHKRCLQRYGYRAESFVYYTWYFTQEFDVNFGKYCPRAIGPYVSYVFCLFRYKCLYLYFSGGPLGFTTLLARCEPFLYQLAGITTVVMPFGADVDILTRSKNRLMVHAFAKDYPGFRHSRRRTIALVDAWTHGADHIISGCDWVDFLYYWDTLMLAHFAVDTDLLKPRERAASSDDPRRPLRLLHAPNHRNLKGTQHLIDAVHELRADGVAIELHVVEGVSNAEVPAFIENADVVVDQLVLGWYAMFAIEAMSLEKPVVCYIRPDFLDLYIGAGLLKPDELPLIDASIHTIKLTLRQLAERPREELQDIGKKSRVFVERHHSIEAVGRVFDRINRVLGLAPSQRTDRP